MTDQRTFRGLVMLDRPPSPAPEPYATAALWLLYQVALFIRNTEIETEQRIDIGDAIHNVPESLTEYGGYFDERKIREDYLAPYDSKWARSPGSFSLIRTLNEGIELAIKWRGKHN